MVTILIRFYYYLNKLAKGNLLDDFELNIIKAYLAYDYNLYLIFPAAIFFLLLLVSFIFLIINNYLLFIVLLIISLLGIVYFTPILFFLYRKNYKKALKRYLEVKLNKYKNKRLIYTYYEIHSDFNINKNSVYCLYDNYYLIILEDMLKKEYFRKHIFKYPDSFSIDKAPIIIKLNDVTSFLVNKDLNYRDSLVIDLINKEVEKEEICQINLSDFKSLILGYEIGLVLNNIIPYLNETN